MRLLELLAFSFLDIGKIYILNFFKVKMGTDYELRYISIYCGSTQMRTTAIFDSKCTTLTVLLLQFSIWCNVRHVVRVWRRTYGHLITIALSAK